MWSSGLPAMKLTQQRVNLIKELDLRAEFVCEMIGSYCAAISARRMNILIDFVVDS